MAVFYTADCRGCMEALRAFTEPAGPEASAPKLVCRTRVLRYSIRV